MLPRTTIRQRHLIITKGAFANVLAICSSVDQDGVDVPLATGRQAELEAFYQAKGAEGFRVLAVATRKVAAKEHYVHSDESGMAFAGFLLFSDPPKSDARQTIRDLTNLGIRIKVISGDNRYVTAHLAEAVGLDPKSMITGRGTGEAQGRGALAPRPAHRSLRRD